MKCCVYPGSFDPFTLGHLDIAKRARKLFDKVVILIADNSNKNVRMVNRDKMKLAIEATLVGAESVEDGKEYDVASLGYQVDILPSGLTVLDYMSNHRDELDSCMNIIRGIRNSADAMAEIDLAGYYTYFSHNIRFEFIPLLASDRFRHVSSSLVREMFKMNNARPMYDFAVSVPLPGPVYEICCAEYPTRRLTDVIADMCSCLK